MSYLPLLYAFSCTVNVRTIRESLSQTAQFPALDGETVLEDLADFAFATDCPGNLRSHHLRFSSVLVYPVREKRAGLEGGFQ